MWEEEKGWVEEENISNIMKHQENTQEERRLKVYDLLMHHVAPSRFISLSTELTCWVEISSRFVVELNMVVE